MWLEASQVSEYDGECSIHQTVGRYSDRIVARPLTHGQVQLPIENGDLDVSVAWGHDDFAL